MKLIDMDDCGDSYNAISQRWSTAGGATLTATNARTGSSCITFNATNSCRKTIPAADEHATVEIGFVFYRTSGTSINGRAEFFSDAGATTHVVIVLGTDLIEVRRSSAAGTLLGSYTGSVPTGMSHHVEVKATLNDTTGAVQVWLNGASVISVSGVDTKNAGTKTVFDSIGFGISTSTGGFYIDDIFVLNGATDTPDITSPLGDRRVITILPNADGNSRTWTGVGTVVGAGTAGTYQNVDEASPNTSDYNYAASGKDTYGFPDVSSVDSTSIVDGVMVSLYAAKDDVATKYVKPVVRTAGSDYSGTSQALASGFAYYRQVYRRGPDSVNWDLTKFNAAEFGAEASDT